MRAGVYVGERRGRRRGAKDECKDGMDAYTQQMTG